MEDNPESVLLQVIVGQRQAAHWTVHVTCTAATPKVALHSPITVVAFH